LFIESQVSRVSVRVEQLSDEMNAKDQLRDSINRQLRVVKGIVRTTFTISTYIL